MKCLLCVNASSECGRCQALMTGAPGLSCVCAPTGASEGVPGPVKFEPAPDCDAASKRGSPEEARARTHVHTRRSASGCRLRFAAYHYALEGAPGLTEPGLALPRAAREERLEFLHKSCFIKALCGGKPVHGGVTLGGGGLEKFAHASLSQNISPH